MSIETDKLLDENGNIPTALSRIIAAAAGILWRMRQTDRQLELISDPKSESFSDLGEVRRLLTDLVHAQEAVLEDDFFHFKMFIKNIREGQPAFVLFRVHDSEGQVRWLKAAGAPGETDRGFYYGYIQDITVNVILINQRLEKDLARQTMLQKLDIPALLVDMKTKAVISRNTHAHGFFGYDFDEFDRLPLRELYPPEHESSFIKAYETCFMEGVWEGPLRLKIKNGETRQVIARLKRLAIQDLNLLRISIPEVLSPEEGDVSAAPAALDKESYMRRMEEVLEGKESIADILDGIRVNPYENIQLEALMFIDLHSRRKKESILAVGEPFARSDFGGFSNVEGTLMQDILERRVDHVILEDTLESTRPIDWALFIPYGIRSYFVKPFFYGSKLRTLLFFCSTEAGAFSQKNLDKYEAYCTVFTKALRKWRKRPRRAQQI